jgi:hypothetical protein
MSRSPEQTRKLKETILALPTEVKPFRVALYILAAFAMSAALFLQLPLHAAVGRGAISPSWLFMPLVVYCAFFVAYAVDRWLLVRRRSFPGGRAFFQVIFGVLFGLMLLPSTTLEWHASRPSGLVRLMNSSDSEYRWIAVQAVGYRGRSSDGVRSLLTSLSDSDERVQKEAAVILGKWAEKDPSDVAGIRLWAGQLLSQTRTSTTEEK